MWALWQQVRLQEIILDRFEGDIQRVKHQADLISEFVKEETQITKKLQTLRESEKAHRATKRIYERRIIELNRELVS